MARNSRTRGPVQLPQSLDHHLNLYALAAGAAGVGLLALASPADAKVVYTATNVTVSETNTSVPIDFNHDGIPDAKLSVYGYCAQGSGDFRCFGSIFADGMQGNMALQSNQGEFAAAVPQGKPIGPGEPFKPSASKMAKCFFNSFFGQVSSTSQGPWVNVTNHYLGFKFLIKGEAHYGWARMTSRARGFSCTPDGTLTGYAYETEPNKPIEAGATDPALPGTLGQLTVGATKP
jgi:hypothetical protein